MAIHQFTKEAHNEAAQRNRDYEYEKTIHPMLVKIQLGQITQEELQAAVTAIDEKFPFVDADYEIDDSVDIVTTV